jgi:glutathione S-transferase
MALTLYYYPGACSLAPHIVLREAEYAFELERVDLARHTLASGESYLAINSNGYVPALRLDDGEILTEAGVIVQYLADQAPERELAPRFGTMQRYRLMEKLNFITGEIHKAFSPLFNPKITDEWKNNQLELLARRFDYVDGVLQKEGFITGSRYSVADAYLYAVLRWSGQFGISLARWPSLEQYRAKLESRPAVAAALHAEGLADS